MPSVKAAKMDHKENE